MLTVRNIPECKSESKKKTNNLPFITVHENKIIVYQGALNVGRGIEHMIDAMQYIDNAVFLIIGEGDISDELKEKVNSLQLNKKVIFKGKISFSDIHEYTSQADIGITIEENYSLNYYYALPNKLFDYIRATVPILASKLPEIEKIINKYEIGEFIENHNPEHIAEKVKIMLNNSEKQEFWKKNLQKASNEFCWENEESVLKQIFEKLC